jgi:hypothetical protein
MLLVRSSISSVALKKDDLAIERNPLFEVASSLAFSSCARELVFNEGRKKFLPSCQSCCANRSGNTTPIEQRDRLLQERVI